MSATPLAGKVALVTGGARGLGRGFALRLATLGADVAIVDRDLNSAAEYGETLEAASVAAEIELRGRRGLGIQADVAQREQMFSAVERVVAAFGRLDVLVNCAGGAITPNDRSAASIAPEADVRLLFDVNFLGTMHCCQAAALVMKRQGSGVIVNVTSQAGATTYGDGTRLAGYAATKSAVAQYTRYLAAELGPFGVRANCISPGIMLTARIVAQAAARGIGGDAEAKTIPLRRLGRVEDCADVLEFLATDLSRYVTGQVISVCGGAVLTPS